MGISSFDKTPIRIPFGRNRRERQATVIVVGLLSWGFPRPFYPVPLLFHPCGLLQSRFPYLSAGQVASYSCGICRFLTFWECCPPFGFPLSPFNCQTDLLSITWKIKDTITIDLKSSFLMILC